MKTHAYTYIVEGINFYAERLKPSVGKKLFKWIQTKKWNGLHEILLFDICHAGILLPFLCFKVQVTNPLCTFAVNLGTSESNIWKYWLKYCYNFPPFNAVDKSHYGCHLCLCSWKIREILWLALGWLGRVVLAYS